MDHHESCPDSQIRGFQVHQHVLRLLEDWNPYDFILVSTHLILLQKAPISDTNCCPVNTIVDGGLK